MHSEITCGQKGDGYLGYPMIIEVGTDAIVGAVAGGVGGGAASVLTKGAQVARVAVLTGDDVTRGAQLAYGVLGNTTSRAAIAGGASGMAGNMTNYGINTTDPTLGGYLQAGGTGLLTGAGGSALTSRFGAALSNAVGQELTPGWVGAVSNSTHAGAPVNYGQVLTEISANHVAGGVVGAVNAQMKPDGASKVDIASGFIQGFVGGAEGPSTPIR